MLISCPHCGKRPHAEFTYGGDATLGPRPDATAPDAAWMDFVYLRDNPCGPHREYWHHTLGCECWIVVERDTLTHRISGSHLARTQART
jgi:heterotetrameric sarcosine oxidase delta subunit